MFNIKMTFQYDGRRYNGWQRLKKQASTLQGRIEFVLSQLIGKEVEIIGASRTDKGVHALGQVANFKVDESFRIDEIESYLHQYLPKDIHLVHIERVPDQFHARYNAKGKRYLYQIWNSPDKNVFKQYYHHQVQESIDINRMLIAKDLLIGKHNFINFTVGKAKNKNTFKTIETIDISQKEEEIFITVIGDGFLHKMVRIICGTLLQIGLHKMEIKDLKKMLTGKAIPSDMKVSLPANGLFLCDVFYQ